MKPNKRSALHAAVCAALLCGTLVVFVLVGYIDGSVIRRVYLPIGVVAVVAMLLRQTVFAYAFAGAAVLGLIVEYLIHVSQAYPSMKAHLPTP